MRNSNVDGQLFARQVKRLANGENVSSIRVIHSLDGIEGPVPPDALQACIRNLWTVWRSYSNTLLPDMLVGLDSGGIVPTVGLAIHTGIPYRLAWKLDLDLPVKAVFQEPGAERKEVFVYGDYSGANVLVVDDEITTGATVTNAIRSLEAQGANVIGVLVLVEDAESSGRQMLTKLGVPLCALTVI